MTPFRKLTAAVALAAFAVPAGASAQSVKHEVGYERGALGFEALKAKKPDLAERQILSDRSAASDDPAKLINLGTVYLTTNRSAMAKDAFSKVLAAEEVDLVLANGTERGSHAIAREGLRQVERKDASR